MKYIELTVHTSTFASEIISDIMWNYTDFGVAICDVNDIIALQNDKNVFWDYIDDSLKVNENADVLVKCFIEPKIADNVIKSILSDVEKAKNNCGEEFSFGSLEATKREIEGDDWIDIWKKHFRDIHIKDVVICPEWIKYSPKPNEKMILLDSNMAFGTGEHETTSMCLEFLQDYLKQGDTVIDVGCGSGILGIAGVLLGAKKAYLTDIDPVAVSSATHNATLNKVIDFCEIAHSNLLNDSNIVGDVMLANITADVLIILSKTMSNNLKKGGILILSGIINDRLDGVLKAYSEVGLTLIEQKQKGEWRALVYKNE